MGSHSVNITGDYSATFTWAAMFLCGGMFSLALGGSLVGSSNSGFTVTTSVNDSCKNRIELFPSSRGKNEERGIPQTRGAEKKSGVTEVVGYSSPCQSSAASGLSHRSGKLILGNL